MRTDFQLDDVQQQVVDMFAEVLDVPDEVGPESDFFDLGGNSLLAARTVAELRRRFGVAVKVREVFAARTVASLTELVSQRMTSQPE